MYAYFKNVFLSLDIFLNVIFGGAMGQTISLRAAIAASKGSIPGCVICKILSALVERDHCRKQLEPDATPLSAALRGGAMLLSIAFILSRLPMVCLFVASLFL